MKSSGIVLLCLTGVLFLACPETPEDEVNPYRQEQIPWPSLADSPWPMYLHDPQHTGRSTYSGASQGAVDWYFATGGNIYASPSVGTNGIVYITSEGGSMYAVSPEGTLVWEFPTGGSDSSPLITSDGRVYFTSSDGFLYCTDLSGQLLWQYELACGTWMTEPTISIDGETIFLQAPCGSINKFYAIRRDGTLRWELDIPGLTRYGPAVSPDGSILYIPVKGGLTALDTSGVVRWTFDVTLYYDYVQVWPTQYPAVDNAGNVYFMNAWICWCVTAAGELRWQFDTNWHYSNIAPTIGSDGSIYVAGFDPGAMAPGIYCLSNEGEVTWYFDIGLIRSSKMILTPVTSDAEGLLYVGLSTTGTIEDSINFLILKPDGTLHKAISLNHPEAGIPADKIYPDIDSTPAVGLNNRVYVGSDRPIGVYLFSVR